MYEVVHKAVDIVKHQRIESNTRFEFMKYIRLSCSPYLHLDHDECVSYYAYIVCWTWILVKPTSIHVTKQLPGRSDLKAIYLHLPSTVPKNHEVDVPYSTEIHNAIIMKPMSLMYVYTDGYLLVNELPTIHIEVVLLNLGRVCTDSILYTPEVRRSSISFWMVQDDRTNSSLYLIPRESSH